MPLLKMSPFGEVVYSSIEVFLIAIWKDDCYDHFFYNQAPKGPCYPTLIVSLGTLASDRHEPYWKACFLYGLLEKKGRGVKGSFVRLANQMIRLGLSCAKIHSKVALYPNRKVSRTSFLRSLFATIPFLPHTI